LISIRAAPARNAGSHPAANGSRGRFAKCTWVALGANTKHGLRLSIADKRRGVMKLLQDDEWRRMSDGEIAKHVGVSDRFVAKLRRELAVHTPNVRSMERKFIHPKTGALTTMRIGKIGRQKAQSKKLATEAPVDRGERAIVVPPAKHSASVRGSPAHETHLYEGLLDALKPIDEFCQANDAVVIARSVPLDQHEDIGKLSVAAAGWLRNFALSLKLVRP
jgi:hypothetical protein